MNIHRTLFLSLSILMISLPVIGAEKMRVAILDIQPKGVATSVASGVSELIRTDMIDVGVFTVVERGQMNEILKEQGFQQTGCTDSSCAVQLGRLVSARKILIGEMSRLGGGTIITVRIVDVEKGVAEYAASEKAVDDNDLDKAARRISLKLIERITGKRGAELLEKSHAKTMTGYYFRGIVPGWGQLYSGHSYKGYVLMSTFALSGVFLGYSVYNFMERHEAYKDVPAGEPQSEYDSKYDDYEKAGTMAYVSLGIFTAIYLYNWVDIIFFSRPSSSVSGYSGFESGNEWYLTIDAGSLIQDNYKSGISIALTRRF